MHPEDDADLFAPSVPQPMLFPLPIMSWLWVCRLQARPDLAFTSLCRGMAALPVPREMDISAAAKARHEPTLIPRTAHNPH